VIEKHCADIVALLTVDYAEAEFQPVPFQSVRFPEASLLSTRIDISAAVMQINLVERFRIKRLLVGSK